MQKMYPLRLKGITKSPIWGGKRLLLDWGKTSDADTVGESWELTVRPNEMCTVENGRFAGMPLGALIQTHKEAILGASSTPDGEFPLLIKFIDAGDKLSVQVHPDDRYAARVENGRGKTEMWYIVEADAGAEIVCGLADGVDRDTYANMVAAGDTESALRRIPVHAGETYFIPAGLPHAIGGGILIAEIQQNCDLTYRVFDYNRRQKDGTLRELHIEKALDVIRPFTDAEVDAVRYSNGTDAKNGELLADCTYFRVERLSLDGARMLSASKHMRHVLALSGEIAWECDGEMGIIARGESWLLPAALGDVSLQGTGCLLISTAY